MSTSDQPQRVADLSSGGGQLTRKQLREARLTGSTPIVTPEEAQAARLQDAANAQRVAGPDASHAPVAPEPVAAEPVAEPGHDAEEPLTRRQLREQERIRTGSVPVHDAAAPAASAAPVVLPSAIPERPATPAPAPAPTLPAPEAAPAPPAPEAAPAQPAPEAAQPADGMITDVPRPVYPSRRRSYEPAAPVAPAPSRSAEEQDGVDDAEQGVAPVSASAVMRAEEETGRSWHATPAPETTEAEAVPAPARPATPAPAPVEAAPAVADAPDPEPEPTLWSALAAESDAGRKGPDAEASPGPDATAGSSLNPAFGERVLAEQPTPPAVESFDALIVDSTGSHHAAPNALIFQTAPTGPSLAGPIASTGEILITGSYELPAGLGSRGHADGVADGKEVDAVLVDGELAPASSPTPIAASAAIGTIKPAGEVIRPPEPEKGNRLMLALTVTAGALAVALVGALIVAITTGAFS